MRVAEAQSRLDPETLASYAAVTARNLIVTKYRSDGRHRRHIHRLVEYNSIGDPEELALRREENDALAIALGSRPRRRPRTSALPRSRRHRHRHARRALRLDPGRNRRCAWRVPGRSAPRVRARPPRRRAHECSLPSRAPRDLGRRHETAEEPRRGRTPRPLPHLCRVRARRWSSGGGPSPAGSRSVASSAAFKALAGKLRTPKGQAAAGGATAAVVARRDRGRRALRWRRARRAERPAGCPPRRRRRRCRLCRHSPPATSPSSPSRPMGLRRTPARRSRHEASRSSRSSPVARGSA